MLGEKIFQVIFSLRGTDLSLNILLIIGTYYS